MTYDADAVIIGAGVAGSSAAKVLADRGWRTVCFDRRVFPRHKVCGEFLSPEAKQTLSDMELLDAVAELIPSTIDRVRISFGQGRPLELPLVDPAYGISRYRLDCALHEAAVRSGVQMNAGTLITNVTRSGDGFVLDTRQGSERQVISARCVIAAWGNQPMREGRADAARHIVTAKNQNHQRIGLKSHYTGVAIDQAVELYFVPEGYVGIVRLDEETVNVAALVRQDRTAAKWTVQDKLEAVISSNRQLQQRLGQAAPVPGSDAAVFPVALNKQPLLWDEVPRIGDAGVMIPPLCGDGMSIALYTANLCARTADRYLAGELSVEQWRQQYVTSVRRAVRQPLRWGRAIHGLTDRSLNLRWLQAIGALAPSVATRIVQRTRLGL